MEGLCYASSYQQKQHLKASSLIFNTNGGEFRLQTPAGEELGFSPEIPSPLRLM